MPDILHRVGIRSSSPKSTYEALTTTAGLANWWTDDVKGEATRGGTLRFRFGDRGGFEMKVLDTTPPRLIRWQVTDGPTEWIGTTVRFDLRQDGDYTILLFSHEGWKEPVEFMHHCSTKWAVFLLSLKSLVETGRGAPYPHDVKIDDWN